MAKPRTIQRFRRESSDVESKIVSAIQKVGPRNISKLSRLTGIHPETVRYKVNKRFSRLGFHVHAEVDYRLLGLVPHWVEMRLSPSFAGSAKLLFETLNQSSYLTYYGKLLPQGSYACLFNIPEGRQKDHESYLDHLQQAQIISGYSMNEIAVSRHPTMEPSFFNFQSNCWDVDWSSIKLSHGDAMSAGILTRPARIDYLDLLLVKELQVNALQHIIAVAKKLNVNEKTAEYHYRAHLREKKLVTGYLIRWQHDIETSVSHSVLMARLTFRNLGSYASVVQKVVSKIPFVWEEDLLTDGTYVAIVHIPIQEVNSTFKYLNGQVPDLYGKVEVSFTEKTEACAFTIPYQMFEKGWKYDVEKMKSTVLSLK